MTPMDMAILTLFQLTEVQDRKTRVPEEHMVEPIINLGIMTGETQMFMDITIVEEEKLNREKNGEEREKLMVELIVGEEATLSLIT